jgi:nucleotide-binding universal stress UspA family protein
LYERIVVGTDGSQTAAEAVRQAIGLAKATGAALDIVSAYEPVSRHRLREESGEIPGDVAHSVGPREDVNVILEGAAGPAQEAGVEVQTHAREGDPADAIPRRGRQQGHDRRPALPPRQRAEQDQPSRPLRRVHRSHHVAGRAPA